MECLESSNRGEKRQADKEQVTNKKVEAKSGLVCGEQITTATSEFLYNSRKVTYIKLKQVLITPLTVVELMRRKLVIELAREIVEAVEGERSKGQRDCRCHRIDGNPG